jgi:hypothetical protein
VKRQTTAQQDARIAPAFGPILNLGRDATGAEIKAEVFEWIRGQVQDYERRQNVRTFIPSPLDPM